MTKPEKIWLDFVACNKIDMAYDEPPINEYSDCRDQYTRSDLIPALEAAAEERGRIAGLREAAEAVDPAIFVYMGGPPPQAMRTARAVHDAILARIHAANPMPPNPVDDSQTADPAVKTTLAEALAVPEVKALVERAADGVLAEYKDSQEQEWTFRRDHVENVVARVIAAALRGEVGNE